MSLWARVEALKYGVETCDFSCKERIKNSTKRWTSHADSILGLKRPNILWLLWNPMYPMHCKWRVGPYYRDKLKAKVKPAILSKRRGLQSKGILFLQDSACPHKALTTLKTTESLNCELITSPSIQSWSGPIRFSPVRSHESTAR